MKKALLLFLLVPYYAIAQDEPLPPEEPHAEEKKSWFSAGIMLMPEYISFFRAEPTDSIEILPKAGFSAGLNLEFSLTPKLSLRTGLGYGQKNLGINHNGLIFNSDLDLTGGGMGTTSRAELRYHYNEIQLPVLFQYEMIEDRFFVSAGTELIYAMPGNSERTIYYGNGTVEKSHIESYDRVNVCVSISSGYKFHFAGNLNLTVEPMFRYCLIPYPINDGVVYSFGLKTTLNMEF